MAQQAHFIVHDFPERPGVHGHHRNAAGHGFENDQAKGFLITGMHQRIGTGHEAGQLSRRAKVVDDGDVIRYQCWHL